MPLKKDPLLEALSEKRDELKTRYRDSEGRAPVVCTDDALKEMAKRKPLQKSDFLAIQGLGDVFVERYAEDFLRVIFKHKNDMVRQVNVSRKSKRVLADYKDRLTDISRRNRNLYAGKLTNRVAMDLAIPTLEGSLKKMMLFQGGKALKLTNRKSGNKEEDQFYRNLTLLYREVNREAKETGSYHLHIAFPFVQGRLPGEGFEVKAPLMFFPVTLERQGLDFYLQFDKERDVVLNRDLLLAHHKFNGIDDIKDMPDSEELTVQNIDSVVLPFLAKNHLDVYRQSSGKLDFEPFENTVKDDFKKIKKGHLTLRNYLVLGKYKIYSSKIQEDISSIIDSKKYNHLLDGLIDNPYEPYDYSKDNPFDSTAQAAIDEKKLTYINDLNYSQEKVLSLIDSHDKVAIWGPPGTGKSQTITSLIAKQIDKSENVLVVSEKKVALDVIKSRLGYASKFALFMDDAQDKTTFYKQIKNFIDPLPPVRNHNNDRETVDVQIDKMIGKLQKAYHKFYMPDSHDIAAHEIYSRYLPTKKVDDELFPETVYKAFNSRFSILKKEVLDGIEERFDNTTKLRILLQYLAVVQDHPIIHKMNTKLTRSEKIRKKKFDDAFLEFIENYNKTIFLRKRKKRKRFIKTHVDAIEMLFSKRRHAKKFIKTIIKDQTLFETIQKKINEFERARHHLEHTNTEERRYLEMLLNDSPFKEIEKVHLKHSKIFDAFYTGYVEKFEALNQDKVYDLAHYHELMEKLNGHMQEKLEISKEDFAMSLYQDALNFSNSKRIMDIKRQVERQRKWSVSKFIHTYQLELFSNVNVWMMTPEVVSEIIPLNFAMFDLVIFDEASQMFVEKAIPTIYRAKKVVIAGDTKQLRPSSLGAGRLVHDEETFEEDEDTDITLDAQSLLDLARYKYKETILNYHYRSKYEELIAFSNHAFYDGKLIVSPNQRAPRRPPIEYHVCEDGLWENRRNHPEAKKVIEIIKKVLRQKDPSETVGVITFNVQQRNLIEDMLDELLFSSKAYAKRLEKEMNRIEDGEDRSLFVKNIENVQGDERDIIIFSTAYARNKEGRFLRQFGWLNNDGGENRLNVAVSRAKKKIFMVTSFYPNQFHVEDLKSQGPLRLKQYLQYCYGISGGNIDASTNVLETLTDSEISRPGETLNTLQSDIMNRLEKEDFKVKTNIGIGGYKIDFGVAHENDREFKLGIVCDVSDTNNVQDIRDAFVHQEKYLRARGWNIYRILGPNWYKGPNAIMRDIRKILRET